MHLHCFIAALLARRHTRVACSPNRTDGVRRSLWFPYVTSECLPTDLQTTAGDSRFVFLRRRKGRQTQTLCPVSSKYPKYRYIWKVSICFHKFIIIIIKPTTIRLPIRRRSTPIRLRFASNGSRTAVESNLPKSINNNITP